MKMQINKQKCPKQPVTQISPSANAIKTNGNNTTEEFILLQGFHQYAYLYPQHV